MTRHGFFPSLIRGVGFDLYAVLPFVVDKLLRYGAFQPDHVGEVDEPPVFARASFEPAPVSGIVCQKVYLPGVPLIPNVILIRQALCLRGFLVVVDRIDRLQPVAVRVTKGPLGMAPVELERQAVCQKPWYRSTTSDEKGDLVGYGERALDDGLELPGLSRHRPSTVNGHRFAPRRALLPQPWPTLLRSTGGVVEYDGTSRSFSPVPFPYA